MAPVVASRLRLQSSRLKAKQATRQEVWRSINTSYKNIDNILIVDKKEQDSLVWIQNETYTTFDRYPLLSSVNGKRIIMHCQCVPIASRWVLRKPNKGLLVERSNLLLQITDLLLKLLDELVVRVPTLLSLNFPRRFGNIFAEMKKRKSLKLEHHHCGKNRRNWRAVSFGHNMA